MGWQGEQKRASLGVGEVCCKQSSIEECLYKHTSHMWEEGDLAAGGRFVFQKRERSYKSSMRDSVAVQHGEVEEPNFGDLWWLCLGGVEKFGVVERNWLDRGVYTQLSLKRNTKGEGEGEGGRQGRKFELGAQENLLA